VELLIFIVQGILISLLIGSRKRSERGAAPASAAADEGMGEVVERRQ
jgi:hypothetical protein